MSRDIYLPPKALREIEDPTPPEPADLVEAIRGHIADHSGDPEWAATVTADEIANAIARRGYDGRYLDRVLGPSDSEDIEITVCSDCYCAAANGLDSIDVDDKRRTEIAAGFEREGNIVVDVDDEGHFSSTWCQVCKTNLGGTRLRAWVTA